MLSINEYSREFIRAGEEMTLERTILKGATYEIAPSMVLIVIPVINHPLLQDALRDPCISHLVAEWCIQKALAAYRSVVDHRHQTLDKHLN